MDRSTIVHENLLARVASGDLPQGKPPSGPLSAEAAVEKEQSAARARLRQAVDPTLARARLRFGHAGARPAQGLAGHHQTLQAAPAQPLPARCPVMLQHLKRALRQHQLRDPAYQFLFDPAPPDEWVSIDCETTGLDARRDRIVSIAAVRIAAGLSVVEPPALDTLIDPRMPIPARAVAVHGIDNAQVAGAPTIAEAYDDILAALSGCVVVGHYVSFDLAMLAGEARRNGCDWREPPHFDTFELMAGLGLAADYFTEHRFCCHIIFLIRF